jgi:catechol 2,3-dioxygenase-like lactoylglutathione lyase family enzyme
MGKVMNPTLNTIDIVVSDMEATMGFYARLGLEFKLDPNSPEHAGCDLPNGLHVMLDTEPFRTPFLPGWIAPTGGPRTMLCFEFPIPAEVDAKYGELVEAGYRGLAEPFEAFWGMRYATVLDPDGNGVDLYATLPPR